MHLLGIAAFAVALLMQPLIASAQERDADAVARDYFAHACADKVERIAVYAPDIDLLRDITTGATSHSVSWDRFKFEELCAHPVLYVYHCHTTQDVLTRFPSGSTGSVPGDFGNAAEMEFACAKAGVLNHHAPASLVHGLVTPRGEVIHYGFSQPMQTAIREQGRHFGELLKAAASKSDLERAQAAAQHLFNDLNAKHFEDFIHFAVKTCPNGDIEHCQGLTVENFAAALPPDDWRFIRVSAGPVVDPAAAETPSRDRVAPARDTPLMKSAAVAESETNAAFAPRGTAELTPETLGAFVSDGRAMVSICGQHDEGLLPCEASKARMARLAEACPRVKRGILDQDRYPQAKYLYPVARDRSLLLFKTNPQSGVNEQFNLTISSEPTPQLIAMVLCDQAPFEMPSFAQ
jgi:hypothetical protein